jgi:hypothetical protein
MKDGNYFYAKLHYNIKLILKVMNNIQIKKKQVSVLKIPVFL